MNWIACGRKMRIGICVLRDAPAWLSYAAVHKVVKIQPKYRREQTPFELQIPILPLLCYEKALDLFRLLVIMLFNNITKPLNMPATGKSTDVS